MSGDARSQIQSTAGESRSPRRSRTVLYATALVTLAISLIVILRLMVRPSIDPANRTIVVMSFENLGAASDAYFADGLSEEIADQLSRLPGVKVIGRDGVRGATVATMRPREVAAALGAQYVLSGTVQWARADSSGIDGNARVRVVPVLMEASVGEQLWSQSFVERLSDVFTVPSTVAERVADALSVKLSPQDRLALAPDPRRDPIARDAQLVGRQLLRMRGRANLESAVQQFERAITRDSLNARAWAGLAESCSLLPAYSRVESAWPALRARARFAAVRAVTLDSSSADAWLAIARTQVDDGHTQQALQTVNHAIALDSANAHALVFQADVLSLLGRVVEQGNALQRAMQIDRLSPFVHNARNYWFMSMNQADSAVASGERAMRLDPSGALWRANTAVAYAFGGHVDDAIRVCALDELLDRCRALWSGLAAAAPVGNAAIIDLIATLRAEGRFTTGRLAVVYARAGATDSAMALMQRGVARFDDSVRPWINHPWLAPLRSDPQWETIVRAVRR